ncbi:hypothetical protein GF325_11635, partial [Candidatus Bathyarchaeota archaeon]|nr:hypothetical protein [Candidatus Bathyarchaeota archaeon]
FQTCRKAIVTYKKAAWHIKHHDDFTFAASQPLLLDWILREDPGLFEEIKEMVEEGRMDLVGGFWVEPDCHLPSGESFVRQRLYGQRFYLKHFGKVSNVEWVPDSFGFASTLPQIIAKSGGNYFYTTKLHGNRYTPFPFINFKWIAPDGSSVIACLNPGGWGGFTRFPSTRERRRLLEDGETLVADYLVDAPEDSPLFVDDIPGPCAFIGKGDGGHGPTGQEVAIMDMLADEYGVKWITASEYFQNVLDPVEHRLPAWKDELYYEFHRGTITTQDLVKRMNRYLEWRCCAVESFAALMHLLCPTSRLESQGRLETAWKLALLNQFHDVLPGSSIPEVYDDAYDTWEHAKNILDDVEGESWELFLQEHGNSMLGHQEIILYNGTGFPVDCFPVELPAADKDWRALKIGNQLVPVQYIDADDFPLDELFVKRPGRYLFTGTIPPHGFIRLVPVRDPGVEVLSSNTGVEDVGNEILMENDLYKVTIEKKTGRISAIMDKAIEQNILGKKGVEFKVFFDWLPDEPCWNILPGYRQMELEMPNPISVTTIESGPVRWMVEIEREFLNEDSESPANATSRIKQRVALIEGSPGIYIEFLVNWRSCEVTAKLDIDTSTGAEEVTAEVPYGTNTRSTCPVANHDQPRWENFHHTWVDMSTPSNEWGLAVINNGKYGYDASGSRLGLTLLRGPKYPAPSGEAWVHQERAKRMQDTGTKPPTHADQGTHLIQYILLPHSGGWQDSVPFIPAIAHGFNEGLSAVITKDRGIDMQLGSAPILTDDNGIEIAAIKQPEDGPGTVIRIVEVKSKARNANVMLDATLEIDSVANVDLLERAGDVQDITIQRNEKGYIKEFSFHVNPHEIKTFLLKR